jgi:hypothetical protein
MFGVALFVFVILALAAWSLHAHGYLGIAVIVVGGVAFFGGALRTLLVWVRRRDLVNQERHQQEEERQEWLRWEQERLPGYEDRPVHSELREEREEEEQPKAPLERDTIAQRLDQMSDGEFEQLMAYYFRRQDCAVDATPASGYRGADLIIVADDRRISVRLKRQDAPIGNGAVREAVGGRAFYGAFEAWIITNGTFAKGTRHDAKVAGVRLVDGEELAGWLGELLLDQLEDEPR